MNNAQATWVIYVTFLVGLILMLIPLPMEWRVIRPDALTLALFYWVMALPHRVGIFTAFCVGLLRDLMQGSPLGLSSPGLMLATLLLLMNYQRVRQYDLLLQCFRSGIELPLVPTGAILGLLLSVLCWVPTRTVLRYFRRYFEVY